MVGKIKHVRQKLHQEAVRLERPGRLTQTTGSALPPGPEQPAASELHKTSAPLLENQKSDSSSGGKQPLGEISFPSGIFAGTRITPEALVQTLKLEEPPDVPTPAQKGPEEKKVKSKKEKMKERRDRWLNKISSIKQAKEQQVAEARRQATPVVGDMRPLADALPELCQLVAPAATAPAARRKSRKNKVSAPPGRHSQARKCRLPQLEAMERRVPLHRLLLHAEQRGWPVKRPTPTDFSQMKQSQKRKFLETETSRFSNAAKTLSAKMNPLSDIGEQLRKRMRQEEEQGPSSNSSRDVLHRR